MTESRPFFRGTELPRMLVLLVLMMVGWVIVWNYLYFHEAVPDDQPDVLVAGDPPAPIEPDPASDFDSVTDNTPIQLRDMAAYVKLLERARATDKDALAKEARQDVLFSHLWERPKHYRGVPVHVLGTAFRIVRYESKHSKNGWLYEAWVVAPDSSPNPYVCVFEDAPKGLPLGDNVNERLVFNGYFLKKMMYESRDQRARAAPLVIGRIGWTPPPVVKVQRQKPIFWMGLAIGVMFLISMGRWIAGLRRSIASRSPSLSSREKPIEVISPEALASYIDHVAEDEGEHGSSGPDD